MQEAVDRVKQFYLEKRGSLPSAREAMEFAKQEAHELVGGDVNVPQPPADAPYREDELKEICDGIFTLVGLALAQGYNLPLAFQRVCASNMTKQPIDPDSFKVTMLGEEPEIRKIQKGPLYVEPYLGDCV